MSLPTVAKLDAPAGTIQAIRAAAKGSGVSFAFMLASAALESGFDPRAQATTSSARGLFQFVEGTWLAMVRDHGAEVGIGDLASKIGTDDGGDPVVGDRATRRQILALRDDPRLSAEFAARLMDDNRRILETRVGPELGAADLYLAHFLGAGQAGKFLNALETTPAAAAADLFPAQAAANPGVFYGADGGALSLERIHRGFATKLANAAESLSVGPVAAPPSHQGTAVRRSPSPSFGDSFALPATGIPRSPLRLDPLTILMLASLDAPADATPRRANVGRANEPQANLARG